ncbi:putative G-patch domain-containing protein [Helianthus annuus]|uniref:G-patch domain-containing protein n=2 Tax=Helianthus annuus TaxID=4232 RepID=A0A9K3JPZ9_HELAN|nr:protein MOS2 [Helianthus annuus]KAF5819091.1 putative G-patch domain-containing protein [Helianthus annuus]
MIPHDPGPVRVPKPSFFQFEPCNNTDLYPPSATMKLSFSLSSSKPPKPSINPPQNHHQTTTTTKEFVTEFDPSQTLTTAKTPDSIAPIANEWKPHKKVKLLNLPDKSEDPNLQFETVNSTVEEIDPNISYGLNIRAKKGSESDLRPKGERSESGSSSIDRLMLDKLRRDLDSLPEHRGMEEFEDMPVEGFGLALLKGYGWEEGRGVGKNAKEDVKVFEITKRTGKEGIGFVNDVPGPPSKDGKNRAASLEKKTVNNDERKERIHSGDRRKDSSGSRDHKRDHDKKTSGKRGRERERYETSGGLSNSKSNKSWLSSHIRVRIISKELKGGRLYLKKGEIVDVVGPTTCDIRMDDGRELIQGVDEEFLETALPRRGGPVLVLYGRYKGVFGSLQEKDMDNETAVVRDADTHGLINVKLEQIAEYVGDPDDIGY